MHRTHCGYGFKAMSRKNKLQPQRLLWIDPTPAGLITMKSLRRNFKSEWARIRKRRFAGGNFICEVCGKDCKNRSGLDGHEVYSYPSPQMVRLDRILFLCRLCHDATHLERTRGKCGPDYVQEVEAHYCRVNGGISLAELRADFNAAQSKGFDLKDFYGGPAASPNVDYGDYKAAVELCLSRRRKYRAELDDDDDDDGDFEMYPDHECPWDIGHAD
jgi:hypothetical protein